MERITADGLLAYLAAGLCFFRETAAAWSHSADPAGRIAGGPRCVKSLEYIADVFRLARKKRPLTCARRQCLTDEEFSSVGWARVSTQDALKCIGAGEDLNCLRVQYFKVF